MGVGSVNGPGFSPLADPAARAPSPQSRPVEKPARASPEPEEKPVQQPAEAPKIRAGPPRTGTRVRIDKASKQIVAQIVGENNEIIKQIPPEEMLEIAAKFRDLQGKLFDIKV